MNALHYWLIAVGAVFVGINVHINGVQLLLPTCVGYVLMGIGAWNLRDEDRIFRHAPVAASMLAVLSFPDLFRQLIIAQASQQHILYIYELWTFYPYAFLHVVLLAGIAVAIAKQARKWDRRPLFGVAVAATVAIIVFEIPRFFMPFPSQPYYIAFFVVTSVYIALLTWVCAWAAIRLP